MTAVAACSTKGCFKQTAQISMSKPRNKTLVMRDKTAGKSVEVVINEAGWRTHLEKEAAVLAPLQP